MQRREFITLLGGAAATWPLAARAQQGERVRRIGVLTGIADEAVAASLRGVPANAGGVGWTDGRNVRIDYRWGEASRHNRKHAAELAALAPDVIFCGGATRGRCYRRPAPYRSCL